ncbi:hypothetical protein [Halpernia sp. GG3]
MKRLYFLYFLMLLFISCENKSRENCVILTYNKSGNNIELNFKNNFNQDVIMLVPNQLEFGDRNFKELSTIGGSEGFYPITVFAKIKSNINSLFYQNKIDSVRNKYLCEYGFDPKYTNFKEKDNTVIFIKANNNLQINFNLVIKQRIPEKYSSRFKQNYYPYNEILKGNFSNSEYLRRFSKLNFGDAKFVVQPIIEDSLILKISDKDVNN